MPPISATDDLRLLAEERVAEARVLLDASHFSGAYYLAGYGVEFGLKAVLTRNLESHVLPDKREIESAHSHDLRLLAGKCGLTPEADPEVRVAWLTIAPKWSPDARYRLHSEVLSREIVESAEEVVKWLKLYW